MSALQIPLKSGKATFKYHPPFGICKFYI